METRKLVRYQFPDRWKSPELKQWYKEERDGDITKKYWKGKVSKTLWLIRHKTWEKKESEGWPCSSNCPGYVSAVLLPITKMKNKKKSTSYPYPVLIFTCIKILYSMNLFILGQRKLKSSCKLLTVVSYFTESYNYSSIPNSLGH
jgi:hypothetical protein